MERVLLGMSGGVAIAAAGLESAHRPGSQDICFVPDGDYMAFLRRFGAPVGGPGDFLDTHGRVLEPPPGPPGHTKGQRRDLGVSATGPCTWWPRIRRKIRWCCTTATSF